MVEITITVEAEVNPTEDEVKVRAAVHNVLANASVTLVSAVKGNTLVAKAKGQNSLLNLRNMLRNDRIRDAARRMLFKSIRGDTLSFYLNKQVAYAGHISFSEETAESPLGPLHFIIQTEAPQQLVEWLAEKSER